MMRDFLKKAINLGLGTLVVTREKVEEVVSELVKKGEVGQDEGKKLVNELIEKGEENKKEMEAQVEKIVRTVTEKLNLPTGEQLNALKSEIEQLKERLNKEKL